MKKHFLLLLTMLLPMMASAAEDVVIDGICYSIVTKAKNAIVKKLPSGKYSGDIVIPSAVDYNNVTCQVTSIADNAFYYSDVTKVVIPGSVTTIGNEAFKQCQYLKSVTLSEGLTTIGSSVFYNCSSLTSIDIPNTVTSIGGYAFDGCTSLGNAYLSNQITTIPDYLFYDCSSLVAVNIPEAVTSIESNAFCDCKKLQEVTIGTNVTTIDGGAFDGCAALKKINIPSSVTKMGWGAFSDCEALEAVYITDLEKWCQIEFEELGANPLVYAKNLYLNGSVIMDLVIPSSITYIRNYTFACAETIHTLTIPTSVTSIGSNAFVACSHLEKLDIPNSVTYIGQKAFYGCQGLPEIVIPNSVTEIDSKAFSYCTAATSITLGKNVSDCGSETFAYCAAVTDVYSYAQRVPTIYSYTFKNSDVEYATLHVLESLEDEYNNHKIWSAFGKIVALSGDTPDDPELPQCAKPTITLQNGEIVFGCETEGVEFHYSITNSGSNAGTGSKASMTTQCAVSVYATKDGYKTSETATATVKVPVGGGTSGLKGDVDGNEKVNIADVVTVVDIILNQSDN